MKDYYENYYYGRCWNCGRNFIKSRIDEMFCSEKCRNEYTYVSVPRCQGCLNECEFRNENRKYAPKESPIRYGNK